MNINHSVDKRPGSRAHSNSSSSFYQNQIFRGSPQTMSALPPNSPPRMIQSSNFHSTIHIENPRPRQNTAYHPYYQTFPRSPQTKKIHFTFLSPDSLQFQRQEILTHIPQIQKQRTNQWEMRYYELSKHMEDFLANHQLMTEQFMELKQQIKNMNETSSKAFYDSHKESLMNKDQQQYEELEEYMKSQEIKFKTKINKLEVEISNLQDKIGNMQKQNQRLSSKCSQLQENLMEYQKQISKLQKEKIKINGEFQSYKSQTYENQQKYEEMRREIENYEDKLAEAQMTLAQIRVKQMEADKIQKTDKYHKEKDNNEKKLQSIIESKNQSIEQLKKYIIEIEARQNQAKSLKNRYEKLYQDKKIEADGFKNTLFFGNHDDNRYIAQYQQKIQELTQMAKEKDEKIKKLKQENKKLDKKIGQIGDNYISQQQLQTLHKKIQHYQNQILNQGGVIYDKLNNKTYDYYNGKVFEESLIYQLKKDNEKLMKMIERLRIGEQVVFTAGFPNTRNSLGKGSKTSDVVMGMKSILADTYFKMEQVISNFTFSEYAEGHKEKDKEKSAIKQSPNIKKSRKSINEESPNKKSSRKISSFENSQRYRIGKQLQMIKIYMLDLDKYWRQLMELVLSQEKGIQASRKKKQAQERQNLLASLNMEQERELNYYKQENLKLTERIDELININNSMKEMRAKQNNTMVANDQYWKEQAKRLEDTKQKLQQKLKKNKNLLENSQSAKQRLQEKASLISMEMERLKRQLIQWQQKYTNLEKLMANSESLSEINAQLTLQLDSFKLKYHQQTSLLKKQISSVTQKYEQKIQQLGRQLHSMEIRNRDIVKELKDQFSTIQEQKYEQISRLQHDLKSKKSQIQELMEKNFNLEQQVEKLLTQLNQYKEKNQKLQILLENSLEEKQEEKGGISMFIHEKIRSLIIEIECLVGQLAILKENRNIDVRSRIKVKFNDVLNVLSGVGIKESEGISEERERQLLLQIQNLKNVLSQKNGEIITLNKILEDKDYEISEWMNNIQKIQHQNRYRAELLRSLFIEIQAVFGEIQVKKDQKNIRDFIFKEIGKGYGVTQQMYI